MGDGQILPLSRLLENGWTLEVEYCKAFEKMMVWRVRKWEGSYIALRTFYDRFGYEKIFASSTRFRHIIDVKMGVGIG